VSRADVEFLREGYEALARGDIETFTALSRERLGPDFEFHQVWDGRVLRGFEGTMEWISDTRETWDDYSQEVEARRPRPRPARSAPAAAGVAGD
jgi:hypothetical protein